MKKLKSKSSSWWRRWLLNLLGFGLLIPAIIVAIAPGPGGTFLILFSLGILSINNPWAARWRDYLLKNHKVLSSYIFPKKHWVIFIWDMAGALAFGLSLALIYHQIGGFWGKIIGSLMLSFAAFIWLSNHQRTDRLIRQFFRKKTKTD